jgi:hypothetical protein
VGKVTQVTKDKKPCFRRVGDHVVGIHGDGTISFRLHGEHTLHYLNISDIYDELVEIEYQKVIENKEIDKNRNRRAFKHVANKKKGTDENRS